MKRVRAVLCRLGLHQDHKYFLGPWYGEAKTATVERCRWCQRLKEGSYKEASR